MAGRSGITAGKIKRFGDKSQRLFLKLSGGARVAPLDTASIKFQRRMKQLCTSEALKEMGIKDKGKRQKIHGLIQKLVDETENAFRGKEADVANLLLLKRDIDNVLGGKAEGQKFARLLLKHEKIAETKWISVRE